MKTLVVYFSRSGHTRQVANEIAARCGADLEMIREPRSRAGGWGYLRSLWQALRHAAPPISAAVKNPADYDLVIIGTPIWSFGLAPPVRSYARQYATYFKQVAFFCTEGGGGDQRAFDELRQICGKPPVATFALIEKQLPESMHKEPLQNFVTRLALG